MKEEVKNKFGKRGTDYEERHQMLGEELLKDPIQTSRGNGFLKSYSTHEHIAKEEVGKEIQEYMKEYWKALKELKYKISEETTGQVHV